MNYSRCVAASLLALLLAVVSPLLWADDASPSPRILVSGEGSAELAPDMAIVVLTVTREGKTARAALDANSEAMSQVLKAMQSKGIESRDLQTSKFSIQPRYSYPARKPGAETESPRIEGYTVRNSLTVRVRDISAVGTILDQTVSLGVNEGGNIIFTNDDPSAAIDKARVEAVRDATAKAQTLAKAAAVKLGKVLEIAEQSRRPQPMPVARAEMAMSRAADAVPVATGENSYKVMVNMSFAIQQ